MSWLRIDDGFVEHVKVAKLRDRTFRLHVAGLCYCARNLTDGHVTGKGVKVLGAILEYTVTRHVAELVEVGLWRPDDAGDGYWINDYLEYNPDAESIKKRRQERSEAGRIGANKRWGKEDDNSYGSTHSSSYGSTHLPAAYPPSPPSPSPLLALTPPTPPSDQGGNDFNEGTDFGTLKRMIDLVPLRRREDARAKIVRTVKANRSPEADLVAAIEAAAGANVRDPLAVILAELKKRADARRAA